MISKLLSDFPGSTYNQVRRLGDIVTKIGNQNLRKCLTSSPPTDSVVGGEDGRNIGKILSYVDRF